MAVIIQKRYDIATNWTTTDPILAMAEEGYEYDTLKSKIGDGVTPWSGLPYIGGTGGCENLDGGTASSVYLTDQNLDGGNA